MPATRLVLASASPRRHALLARLGLDFRVAPVDLDEERHAADDPTLSALTIARAKARHASPSLARDEVLLTADTVVVDGPAALGKPATAAEASRMLRRLRGRSHVVATGVTLLEPGPDGREWSALVTTRVQMRAYADDEIATYVARGEAFDKAGGYAIQDGEFRPVERLDGCYLNVVGLPLCAVERGLETLAVAMAPWDAPAGPLIPPCRYCREAKP